MGKENPATRKKAKEAKKSNMNTNIVVGIEDFLVSSYVDNWRKATKSDRKSCCIKGCKNDILTCVVVRPKDKRRKDKLYYIPVCSDHFRCKTELPVKSEAKLAELNPDNEETGGGTKGAGFIKINRKKGKSGIASPTSPTDKKRTNSNIPGSKKEVDSVVNNDDDNDDNDKCSHIQEYKISDSYIHYGNNTNHNNTSNDDSNDGCIIA